MQRVVDTVKINVVFEYLKEFKDGQVVQIEEGCQTALECLAGFNLDNYPEDSSEWRQADLIAKATRKDGNRPASIASSHYEGGYRESRHPDTQLAYDVLAEAEFKKSLSKRDDDNDLIS